MSTETRTYKPGDTLTLKVKVVEGVSGLCWTLGDGLAKFMLPGNPGIMKSQKRYEDALLKAIISHEPQLCVGDAVRHKDSTDRSDYQHGIVKLVEEGGGTCYVQWDKYGPNYLYRYDSSALERLD